MQHTALGRDLTRRYHSLMWAPSSQRLSTQATLTAMSLKSCFSPQGCLDNSTSSIQIYFILEVKAVLFGHQHFPSISSYCDGVPSMFLAAATGGPWTHSWRRCTRTQGPALSHHLRCRHLSCTVRGFVRSNLEGNRPWGFSGTLEARL